MFVLLEKFYEDSLKQVLTFLLERCFTVNKNIMYLIFHNQTKKNNKLHTFLISKVKNKQHLDQE